MGCDLAALGGKLYSSATRKTYRSWPGCENFFLSPNLAIIINTIYGSFTPLCFLMLFWRLQSRIAQIQTVKIFQRSNFPSSLVASFIRHVVCTKSVLNPNASCSVHEMYHDLSMLVFCFRGHTFVDNFIYKLQKSTTIAFSRNSLYTFYSRNPTCGIHQCLRISNRKYPPCPPNSIIVNPPSPSEILKAVHGMVWIFSGIAQYWPTIISYMYIQLFQ